MIPQVSQLTKSIVGYPLESNFYYLKREVFSINRNKGDLARIRNLLASQFINYYHIFCAFSSTILIYRALIGYSTSFYFNKDCFLTEKRTRGRCLNGQFLTSEFHLTRFNFIVKNERLNRPLLSQNWASGATRLLNRLPKIKNPRKSLSSKGFQLITVVWEGIEPPTQRFSVFCSTD
jgi:hypothetical protein